MALSESIDDYIFKPEFSSPEDRLGHTSDGSKVGAFLRSFSGELPRPVNKSTEDSIKGSQNFSRLQSMEYTNRGMRASTDFNHQIASRMGSVDGSNFKNKVHANSRTPKDVHKNSLSSVDALDIMSHVARPAILGSGWNNSHRPGIPPEEVTTILMNLEKEMQTFNKRDSTKKSFKSEASIMMPAPQNIERIEDYIDKIEFQPTEDSETNAKDALDPSKRLSFRRRASSFFGSTDSHIQISKQPASIFRSDSSHSMDGAYRHHPKPKAAQRSNSFDMSIRNSNKKDSGVTSTAAAARDQSNSRPASVSSVEEPTDFINLKKSSIFEDTDFNSRSSRNPLKSTSQKSSVDGRGSKQTRSRPPSKLFETMLADDIAFQGVNNGNDTGSVHRLEGVEELLAKGLFSSASADMLHFNRNQPPASEEVLSTGQLEESNFNEPSSTHIRIGSGDGDRLMTMVTSSQLSQQQRHSVDKGKVIKLPANSGQRRSSKLMYSMSPDKANGPQFNHPEHQVANQPNYDVVGKYADETERKVGFDVKSDGIVAMERAERVDDGKVLSGDAVEEGEATKDAVSSDGANVRVVHKDDTKCRCILM